MYNGGKKKESGKKKSGLTHFKRRIQCYLFPIVMVYFEIILRICTGTKIFSNLRFRARILGYLYPR